MAGDLQRGRVARGSARRRHAFAAAVLAVVGAHLLVDPAGAGMLDQESCRRIKSEFDTLAASGLREIMAKGPDWAKSNVTKERMEQIRRYLALEEDVRFRCPLGKARPELEAAESEAGATTSVPSGETAPGTSAPAPKPARKTKAAGPAAGKADASAAEATTRNIGAAADGQKSAPTKAASAKASNGQATNAQTTAATSSEPAEDPSRQPARKTPR